MGLGESRRDGSQRPAAWDWTLAMVIVPLGCLVVWIIFAYQVVEPAVTWGSLLAVFAAAPFITSGLVRSRLGAKWALALGFATAVMVIFWLVVALGVYDAVNDCGPQGCLA